MSTFILCETLSEIIMPQEHLGAKPTGPGLGDDLWATQFDFHICLFSVDLVKSLSETHLSFPAARVS